MPFDLPIVLDACAKDLDQILLELLFDDDTPSSPVFPTQRVVLWGVNLFHAHLRRKYTCRVKKKKAGALWTTSSA